MKKFTKRVASIATALAMTASISASAFAADWKLQIVDSTVYGADRTTDDMHTNKEKNQNEFPDIFKQYWSNTLSSFNFLTTPEGLGTFDIRTLKLYDMGTTGISDDTYVKASDISKSTLKNYIQVLNGKLEIAVDKNTGKVTVNNDSAKILNSGGQECTGDECKLDLTNGHYYVLVEDTNANNSAYSYNPNVERGNENQWELVFKWDTSNGNGVADKGFDIQYSKDNVKVENNVIGIPLHDEILRANFSFKLVDKDLQKYITQGAARLTGDGGRHKPIFAVYNINSSADNYDTNHGGIKTGGYVVADRNCNGKLDEIESYSFIPAYDENEIVNAYTEYLRQCVEGNEKYPSGIAETDTDIGRTYWKDGEFVLGKVGANKPIIPVMLLEPDANGVVKSYSSASNIGASGLPAGNYMIVQIQAGNGYYLDENFRPIISVGLWGDGNNDNNPILTNNFGYTGYGVAYPRKIKNTYSGSFSGSFKAGKARETKSPVAYIPAAKVTDLSAIKDSSSLKYISRTGLSSSTGIPSGRELIYKSQTSQNVAGGTYILNPNDSKSSKYKRMLPTVGTSRFTAQDPIIRAGAKVYIADADDVKAAAKGESDSYVIEPQGDGSLDGAIFRLTPYSSAADADNYLWSSKKTISAGKSYEYTVKDNMLLIPYDDLPFGLYKLEQITTGEGYIVPDDLDDEDKKKEYLNIEYLMINTEDTIKVFYNDQLDNKGEPDAKASTIVESFTIDNVTYIPNILVDGGEIYNLSSTTVGSDVGVTITVYNISDHYVYVDKGAGEERVETAQKSYNNQIKGKNLTFAQLKAILEDWDKYIVGTRNLTIDDDEIIMTDTLPYGTYLIAVTDITGPGSDDDKYEITGDILKVDSIDEDDDNIEFETSVDDKSLVPHVNTLFVDAENHIDSIAVKNKVFLRDILKADNLNGGVQYAIYSAIVDKETAEFIKNGNIAFTQATAYLATDNEEELEINTGRIKKAKLLLNDTASKATSYTSDYTAWLQDVLAYAQEINNTTLINEVNLAITTKGEMDSDKIVTFTTCKNDIIGTLKYLAKESSASDVSLEGTLEIDINFDALNTKNLEGKTLVAYDYICEDTGAANTTALAAKNNLDIVSALDSTLIVAHKQISNEDQTVYLPTLDITAEATYTGAKTIDPSETITGTVTYGNLEPGNKYMVEAWLVDPHGATVPMTDPETGEVVKKLSESFTALAKSNDSEFEFTGLDAVEYNNQRLTVYSALYRVENNAVGTPTNYWLIEKGDAASMGYKITDREPGKNQVDIEAPTVTTKLTDNLGRKSVNFDSTVTIKDTVTYKGLVVDGMYNAVLTLVDNEGTTLYDDEGNELVAEYAFRATKSDMTITIPIKIKGLGLRGIDIIAFNDLYRQTDNTVALVAQEHNLLAEDQTIEATGEGYKIVITTVAKNPANNTHVASATANSNITDDVTIRNLEPVTQYMLKTELAYSQDGKVITQFTPVETMITSDENGVVKTSVNISFNALVFMGQNISVYQTVYDASGDNIIASHTDNLDANQMIMIPSLDTVATADDGVAKTLVPEAKQVNTTDDPNAAKQTIYQTTIMDTIEYKNLIAGNPYQITTEVATKKGGAVIGSATIAFTPTTASGTATVYIDIDVTNYRGTDLVVYETINDTYSGNEVISHKDLSDADQTVTIAGDPDTTDPDSPTTSDPGDPDNPDGSGKPGDGTDINTGVAEHFGLFFGIGGGVLLLAGALTAIIIYRRRKEDK